MLVKSSNDNSALQRRIAAGDTAAFEHLFAAYYDQLFSTSLMYVKVRATAEDIVQQVFLRLWERRHRLLEVQNLEGYLYVATRNEILNCLRQQAVRRHYIGLAKENSDRDPVNPEHCLVAKQDKEVLQLAVMKLPEQQRQAWRLSRENGLCYAEIALQMGIAVPTVKSHISNALRSIRGFLAIHQMDLYIALIITFLLRI